MYWGTIAIVISALVAKSAQNNSRLFCVLEENNGKLLPHQNCHQFYKCAHGTAIPFTCPENLLYNPGSKQCDWPELVDCEGRPFDSSDKQVNSDPSQAPAICARPDSDGVLVAHENCNQFYKCFQGKPVALSCPGNLHYNPLKEQCDWPENVVCSYSAVDSGGDIPDYNAQARIICAATKYDGLLLPNEICNKFYKCSFSKPVAQDCPSDLVYNIESQRCDWPENVDCGDRQSGSRGSAVDSASEGSEAAAGCAAAGAGDALLPHARCDRFVLCSAGGAVTFTCAAGLVYNTRTQRCDLRDRVDCGSRS